MLVAALLTPLLAYLPAEAGEITLENPEHEAPSRSPQESEPISAGRLDAHLARLAATAEGRGPLVFQPALLPPEKQVSLYVRSIPGQASAVASAIERAGGVAVHLGGDILSARIPSGSLPELGRLAIVDRAEAALPRRPLLHDSVRDIGSDRVVRGRGLATPLTGQGVILGLVDTGLDYHHPTFNDEDGITRVLAIWDQGVEGEPPPGYSQGRLCERESILDKSCHALDLVGHGTHVGATAGGSDPIFPGVAPDVDFLSSGSLTFELLAESASWIFESADALGRPAVINMSLGGHYGAHDGSTLEEQALTEMSGPGRIIVAAAGNDGGTRIHLSYPLDDEPGRTDILIHPGFLAEGGYIDLWNEAGGEMEVQLAVLDSSDEVAASTGFRGPNDPVFSGRLEAQDGTSLGEAQISFEPSHPDTGKERANVQVVPGSEPNTYAGNPDGWSWVLELRGRGTFHGWIASTAFGSAPASFGVRGNAGDDRSVVAMPATAPGVLAVAAYTTRNAWMDVEGNWFEDDSLKLGEIARFSSGGPSTDPDRTGMKPEIAAPGEYIAAPFGRNAIIFDRTTLLEENVAAMRGTSMAAPHVAGAVALMLEARPEFDRDEILEVLAETARGDEHTGELPNDRWGYGKLDAYEAALHLVGPSEPDLNGGGCDCASAKSGGSWPAASLIVLLPALRMLIFRRLRAAS